MVQAASNEHSMYSVDFSDLYAIPKASEIFKKSGFVVLKNSIPISLIQKVQLELNQEIAKGNINSELRDLHLFADGTVSSAHNLADYLPAFNLLLDLENITALVSKIFGGVSKTSFNSSYFAKPKKQGLETRAHQDNAFFCMDPADVATCWMPITFANKNNGCLYYYPKSQNLGNLNHQPEGNLGASMCISDKILESVSEKYERQYVELVSGDCVLHSALIVHGSEANNSEFDRNAFNFSIASKNSIRNTVLFGQYQEKLKNFLERKKLNRFSTQLFE